MIRIGIPELLILLCVMALSLAAVVYPATLICRRLGFTPWLGVLIIVPFGNLILLWYVALTRWPRFPDYTE
jgi:hypothetical protein